MWPPSTSEIRRKNEWVEQLKNEIAGPGETRQIKLTYELFNPEVQKMQKYFNGPVVEYYIIQSKEMTEGRPGTTERKQYRELILYEMLGYQVDLPGGKKVEERKSTSTFTSVERWYTFLEELKETMFEPNGYEMPDSEQFWELEKEHGYDKTRDVAIEQLQRRLHKKLSTPA